MYFNKNDFKEHAIKKNYFALATDDILDAIEALYNNSVNEYQFLQSIKDMVETDDCYKIIEILLKVELLEGYKTVSPPCNRSFDGIGSRKEVESLFIIANIKVCEIWELKNKYWPDTYAEMIRDNPWWLVLTPFGLIELGPRKNVIEIKWERTPVRHVMTDANVSKSDTFIHVSSLCGVIETFAKLSTQFNSIEAAFNTVIKSAKESL